MKKNIIFFAVFTLFSINFIQAQDDINLSIPKQRLKEGTNLILDEHGFKFYAVVKNKKITAITAKMNGSQEAVEVERGDFALPAPTQTGGGTEVDMDPLCFNCGCIKRDKNGNCKKRKCRPTTCPTSPQ